MPRRLVRSKKRIGSTAELAAWSMVFECGTDYFGELRPFGFHDDAAIARAAPAAWRRLGGQFMRTWQPSIHRDLPWALERFGPP